MTDKARNKIIEQNRKEQHEQERTYCVREFGILPTEFVGYNSGMAYSKVWVNTKEAAMKVSAIIKKQGLTANGGWFDGMPLGQISEDSKGIFEVTC